MENPIEIYDLGVPAFKETPTWLPSNIGGAIWNQDDVYIVPTKWGAF